MTSIIITSISDDKNPVLKHYAAKSKLNNMSFIIAGDKKSPDNFNLDGADFLSFKKQKELGFSLANNLISNHYVRKNIAYLQAIKNSTDIIIETDDDNIPYENFWNKRTLIHKTKFTENTAWLNVYKYFSDQKIWTRGFPLEFINEQKDIAFIEKEVSCPIQQGLVDNNPDVDATFRLVFNLSIKFSENRSIALGKNAISPFNSQNTTWFRQAFPLMYLPSFCSFRMTDIWRSFVAQIIAWTCDWAILYHSPTVFQERNEHNILKDFSDEIPGYLNNAKIMTNLQKINLKRGEENIFDNMLMIYKKMIEKKWITDKKELTLLDNWINDLNRIMY